MSDVSDLSARFHAVYRQADAMWQMGAMQNGELGSVAEACAALFDPFVGTVLERYAYFQQATFFACGARFTIGDRLLLIEAAEAALLRLHESTEPPVPDQENRGIPHIKHLLAEARQFAQRDGLGD